MSMIAPPDDAAHAFEFRSTDWRLVAFAPATLDPVKLEISLREKLGKGEHLLSGEQVALDFSSRFSLDHCYYVEFSAARCHLLYQ